MLEQRDEAAVGVDLEIRSLDPVGEGEGPLARHIVAHRHHLGLEAGRQRVGTEIGDARHLVEADALAAGVGVDHDAVADIQVFGLCLQDRRGCRQHVLPQRLAGLPGRLAADAGGARRPGAAAIGGGVGVAGDDAHALDRHAEGGGDALRHHGLGALALLGHAGMADDRALGVEPQGGAVLRRDAGAADAIKRGRRIGHLDEAREADAAMDAFCRAASSARRATRRSPSCARACRARRDATAARISGPRGEPHG